MFCIMNCHYPCLQFYNISSSPPLCIQFLYFSTSPFTFCFTQYLPKISNCYDVVLLINFLHVIYSFICNFLDEKFPSTFLLLFAFHSVSSSSHEGDLPLSTPFLRPLSFQIPRLNYIIVILLFKLQQHEYNSLPLSLSLFISQISYLSFSLFSSAYRMVTTIYSLVTYYSNT
jgi:hypothetical protein